MKTRLNLAAAVAAGCVCAGAIAAEHDYYQYLRYPKELVPGVGLDKVEQDGGPDAAGYQRRTVEWWPRKGQDFIDIPEGAPLRTWTRHKGGEDKESLAGISRNWMTSEPETFKAHLVAFRGYGISTVNPRQNFAPIPIAVLRMENGELRGVHNAAFYLPMVSREDHEFIHKTWEKACPKLYATVPHDEHLSFTDGGAPGGVYANVNLEVWKDGAPKFNAMEPLKDAKYPRWGRDGYKLVFETPHFYIIAQPDIWGGPWTTPANWIQPDNLARQNQYRTYAMENLENMWTYLAAAGCSMPYVRKPGPNYRFIIHSHRNRAAGGSMHCGISDVDRAGIGHEFFHSMPAGGWEGMYYETWCNAGQHTTVPDEIQMFPGNFCYPWRNVNRLYYQSSFWAFALADNPNWGHAAAVTIASLAGTAEFTPYHTVARLGEKKGLWKNGVKGFGDWFGEYAARMVTVDVIEQSIIRNKYGMPELSCVYPVYGQKNRYRISNAEAPRWCGFNIIRLKPDDGVQEIAVDFEGIHDAARYSDWRACLVAVDGEGRARYSPLWNKGTMRFGLKPEDKHWWLTVASAPSAFPIMQSGGERVSASDLFLEGMRVPRYPWEVTLTGCRPGAPHRRQGDVGGFDDLYGISNNGNKFLDLPVKQEVPIPLTEKYGPLAQEKLAAMLPRIAASATAITDKIQAGTYNKDGWWEMRKMGILNDMARRARFLQSNAKGHPHPNGGGFVADGARVAATAYVGPDAMVLDGARVDDHACIKEFAVILGPKTVISGNAKVSGRAWVFGDIEVSGNARILEAATVTTVKRARRQPLESKAKITGSAVIKGDPNVWLCGNDLTLTGGVVVDHTTDIETGESGVFEHGRFCEPSGRWGSPYFGAGSDDGALYANWQFNQPKDVLLEDSYVNNNGILYGKPEFADDGEDEEHQHIVFNGKDQYAEAPPSVADFGQLTIDMLVKCSELDGRLFDFGTGSDECFYLELTDEGGNLALVAHHAGEIATLTTSEPVSTDAWCRIRVEMDGSEAAIYVNGKLLAKDTFAFSPRAVFAGDRPEGNFIACSRSKGDFFKGKMDHFRIYRAVHKDFNALGPRPYAQTQVQEWSGKWQARADDWDARRKAKEEELNAGEYGKMQQELKKLREQKSALQKTAKPDELANFDARITKLQKESQILRDNALKSAGLIGGNPYPGKNAATIRESQQKVKYHTAADWDYRMAAEIDGAVPPKMKDWLLRFRGY
jgi:hypothetical protein